MGSLWGRLFGSSRKRADQASTASASGVLSEGDAGAKRLLRLALADKKGPAVETLRARVTSNGQAKTHREWIVRIAMLDIANALRDAEAY